MNDFIACPVSKNDQQKLPGQPIFELVPDK
jgi:hypothetical protein